MFIFSAQVFVSAKNPPKMTLHGTVRKAYKSSQGAPLKIMGTAIFFYKVLFLIKCIVVALDEVEVKIYVL